MTAELMRELEAARARITAVEAELAAMREELVTTLDFLMDRGAYGGSRGRFQKKLEGELRKAQAELAALRGLPENEAAIAAASTAVEDVLLHPTGVPNEEIRAALHAATAAVEAELAALWRIG